MAKLSPGAVRDAIRAVMTDAYPAELHVGVVHALVSERLSEEVPRSSVRSGLRLHDSEYEHVRRGYYRLTNG